MATEPTEAASTTIEDLHPDVLTCALRHMDGPTLAAASCATSHLRSLSTNPDIWRHLCLATWPSLRHPRVLRLISSAFPNSHRSFFSDAFPFPFPQNTISTVDDDDQQLPNELISAVDLYHKGSLVFSRVVETDTSSAWFLGSPFRVDGLDPKDPPPQTPADPVISPEDLTLSWVVIDPVGKRAVNVSSRRPVAVDRHWYTGETLVRFAMVLNGCLIGVVVTCREETRHVREVNLTVEDVDGMAVSGRDSLVILKGAMEGGRRGRGNGEEEAAAKRWYEEYIRRKRSRKERKVRREGMMDLGCTAVGVLVFLAFLVMVVSR